MKYKLMNSGNIYQQMIWDLFDIEYERVFRAHTIGYSESEIKSFISPYCREVMHKEAADAIDEILERKQHRLWQILAKREQQSENATVSGGKRAANAHRLIAR